MRISDWSSDVCSSDLAGRQGRAGSADVPRVGAGERVRVERRQAVGVALPAPRGAPVDRFADLPAAGGLHGAIAAVELQARSEEHTSELQSLMRISYAVFCLKKKKHDQYLKKNHEDER